MVTEASSAILTCNYMDTRISALKYCGSGDLLRSPNHQYVSKELGVEAAQYW